jgi:hypothetical protein
MDRSHGFLRQTLLPRPSANAVVVVGLLFATGIEFRSGSSRQPSRRIAQKDLSGWSHHPWATPLETEA